MKKSAMKHIFNSWAQLPKTFIYSRESTVSRRQKLSVFLYGSIILLIGVPLNLLGWTGPDSTFYACLNLINLLVGAVSFIGYCKKFLSLDKALTISLVATQLEISAEIVNCSLHPSDYHISLIVGNLVLTMVLVMLAELAYMRYLPVVLSTIGMGTYTFCLYMLENPILQNFYILLLLVFITVCFLGERLIRNNKALEKENTTLKHDEAELLNLLRLNKQQIKAYIEFSKKEAPTTEDTERLLELIGERSQRNIINTVADYLTEKQTQIDRITVSLPELSPSEREICRLILQGKKLGEICGVLGKTENNVTAHRGHIRKKLGLSPQDNLKEALEKRMNMQY